MPGKVLYVKIGKGALARVMVLLFIALPGFSSLNGFLWGMDKTTPAVGHLEGVIYKADGETPLEEAHIRLTKMERGKKTNKIHKSNVTGKSGQYHMKNIPVGFYKGEIFLKNKRYKIKRVDFFVHVYRDETNFVSFSLKKSGGKP